MNIFIATILTFAVFTIILLTQALKIDSLTKELENAKVEAKIKAVEHQNKVFENNQSFIFKHKKEDKYETPDSIGKHTIDF